MTDGIEVLPAILYTLLDFSFNMTLSVLLTSVQLSRGGGALNFHFGIGMQPDELNRGACEWSTSEFGTLQ